MDILPIEVIFYQSLLLIINLYYKLSIFIKNQHIVILKRILLSILYH